MFPLSFIERVSVPVMNALRYCHKSGCEVRLYYGDTDTGRDWMQENATIGVVKSGAGGKPLLNFGSIPTGAVLAIQRVDDGSFIYRHPKHNMPSLSVQAVGDGFEVRDVFEQTYIRYKSKAACTRWLNFITGKRVCR